MLNQIVHFLLELAAGLIGGACLLRAYMQAQRVPFGNPIGRFVLALTDWLVLPLRRGLPKGARWDLASLLAAWLVKLVQFTLVWLLAGRMLVGWGWVPVLASFGLVLMAISGLSALLILYAVLSWVQPGGGSPLAYVVERLCALVRVCGTTDLAVSAVPGSAKTADNGLRRTNGRLCHSPIIAYNVIPAIENSL